jgi:hypothetical protein
MLNHILARLDEIEALSPDSSEGQKLEAFELMTAFATEPEAVRTLIERYGGSASPVIAQSLAALVPLRAEQPSQETADLVLSFIHRLRCWEPAETVISSLTAVQHILHYVDSEKDLSSLSLFLRKCLTYNGRHSVIIRGHALSLLAILRQRDLFSNAFTPAESVELDSIIAGLRKSSSQELSAELQELDSTS